MPAKLHKGQPENAAQLLPGRHLRILRKERGLTQSQLGNIVGFEQPLISSLENGRRIIDAATFEAISKGLKLSEQERLKFAWAIRVSGMPAGSYGVKVFEGWGNVQRQIYAFELEVSRFREFHNAFIPGLLQTKNYAKWVLGSVGIDDGAAAEVITARLARREMLNDSQKAFEFVLTEQSLYLEDAYKSVMAEELTYLLSLRSYCNVSIGIVPVERGCPPLAKTNFIIYDERYVAAECTTEEQTFDDALTIRQFETAFEAARKAAIFGEDAFDKIASIRNAVG